MAFMAKISDPLIGASYMTLLTTLVSKNIKRSILYCHFDSISVKPWW